MGTFGNHLVLDTSYTVVNDATVTRINYTALWREQDPKQQLTVVKRFVAEPTHKATANRPLQHLANNIHSLRHLTKRLGACNCAQGRDALFRFTDTALCEIEEYDLGRTVVLDAQGKE